MTTTRALESDPRYVFVSTLAEGRRVLDLGCGDGAGLVQLAIAGAEEIVGTAASTAAVHATLQDAEIDGVEVVPDFRPPLRFPDDSFDLIICHDLPDRIKDQPEWIEEIRRLLTDDGYLVLAVANDGGQFLSELAGQHGASKMNYEEVFEELSETFGELALFGQAPVVGSMFFDLQSEEEDPGLTLDGSLLTDDGEDPGWYVLVFGPEGAHRDDLLVVRQPFSKVVQAVRGNFGARPMAPAPRIDPSEIDRLRDQLYELQERLERAEEGAVTADEVEAEAADEVEAEAADEVEAEAAGEAEAETLGAEAGTVAESSTPEHALATVRSLERTVGDMRLRAQRAESESDGLRLELRRAQTNLRDLAGLQAHLSYAKQVAAEQADALLGLESQLDDRDAELASAREGAQRADSLQGRVSAALQVIAGQEADLVHCQVRVRDAEEGLAVQRLESYRAQNELQRREDELRRQVKELERELKVRAEESESLAGRVNELLERREETERVVGGQADRIAQLEQSLVGAEQMFERTKAELIKIERGADERIEENRQLTEQLVAQSKAAGEARLEEALARVRSEEGELRRRQEGELRAETAEAQQRAAAAEDRASGAEARAAELSERLSEREARAAELFERLSEMEARAAEVSEHLSEAEARTAQVSERLAEAQARAAESAERVAILEPAANDAREGLAVAEERTAAAEQRAVEAEHRFEVAQGSADAAEARAAAAEQRAYEAERSIEEARQSAAAGEERSASLEARRAAAEERAASQEAQIAAAQERSATLEAQRAAAEVRVSELELRGSQLESATESLRAESSEREAGLQARISELHVEVEALRTSERAARAAADETVARLAATEAQAREHLATLEARATEELEAAKAAVQAHLADTENAVRRAIEGRDAATARVAELEASLSDAEARLGELDAAAASANQETERLREEALQKLGIAKERVRAALVERDAAREQAASLSGRLAELETEIDGLRSTSATLERDLRASLTGVAEERDAMAREIQRLTDAMSAGGRDVPDSSLDGAGARAGSGRDGDQTVVDGTVMAKLRDQIAAEEVVRAQERDALGREIEPSLENLEDLIKSNPGTSQRR